MRSLIGFIVGIVTVCAMARAETRIEIEWSGGPDLPIPVAGHSAGFVGGQLISAGGSRWEGEKDFPTSVFAWKSGEDQWRRLAKLPSPMTYSASAASERELLIVGGTSGD